MAARDDYPGPRGVDEVLENGITTTGDDSNDLLHVSRAIHVATAGNIKCTTAGGKTQTIAFAAGWHPVRLTRIYSTSLTAVGVSYWW